jgi:MYXO-CTERM domain-containing protein
VSTRRRAIASLVVTALASSASAADLYVAPNGRSGNPGTAASPLDRIAAALDRARPGDRVLVRAGTYPGGAWISAAGTAAAPITVLSVDGPRRAVIVGGDESLRIGEGAAYLVFDGLEVRNAGNNVVHIDGGAHHVWLRNVYAHHAGVEGDVVKVNQAASIYLEGCEFAFPGARLNDENPSQECVDFVDTDDIVVRASYLHDGGNSIIYAKGGSRGVVFEDNVIAGQGPDAIDPMVGLGAVTDGDLLDGADFEVVDIAFRNNVVIGGVAGAVGVYDGRNVVMANNLFVDNDGGVVQFRAGAGPLERSENVWFANNLVVDTRGRMPTPLRRSDHGLTGLSVSHNLFWNNRRPVPTTDLLNLPATAGYLAADPGVHMPAALGDRAAMIAALAPSATGPASGSGRDTSVEPFLVVDDIRGVRRNGRNDRGPWFLGAVTAPPADAGVAAARDGGAATARDAGGDAGAEELREVAVGMQCRATAGAPRGPGGLWAALVLLAGVCARRRRRED